MTVTKEALGNFFEAFGASIDKQNRELYKRIIDGIEIKDFSTPELFYLAVQYPWKKFISGFLSSVVSDNENVKFIFEHYRFIENHFRRMFEKHEGSACCADKSRTMIGALVHHYRTGEEIVLNYGGKYTYHLPSSIFKEHDSIISFYLGLKRLYYGDPLKYCEALASVCKACERKEDGKRATHALAGKEGDIKECTKKSPLNDFHHDLIGPGTMQKPEQIGYANCLCPHCQRAIGGKCGHCGFTALAGKE